EQEPCPWAQVGLLVAVYHHSFQPLIVRAVKM
ncbi:MAG: hypothetical protein QOC63_3574, partial [Mycobacterium sp.]|nr:hypothetical protein [Mycobacterium sp.]